MEPRVDAAYTDFVTRRRASLVRLCWALTGDAGRGEDLAQLALHRLWSRWERVSAAGDPWPYLQKIAVSQAMTWRRRHWHGEVPTDLVPDASEVDLADQLVARRVVEVWLGELPPRQRAVIVLRYLVDLSVEDTAERLGCSAGTVKSQTAKALASLRSRIAETASEGAEA